MEGNHAKFSVSAAYRWTVCPASWRANLNVPRTTNKYAEEGTLVASVLEACLKSPSDRTGILRSQTPDIRTCVNETLDYIAAKIAEIGGSQALSEQRLVIPLKDGDISSFWGTADVVITSIDEKYLEIVDYKHGVVPVEVEANPQLLGYAAGAALGYFYVEGLRKLSYVPEKVVLTIIQPRAFHKDGSIRSWEISLEDLREWYRWILERVAECLSDSPEFVPGDKRCKYCGVSATCEARQEYVLKAPGMGLTRIPLLGDMNLPAPASVDLDRLGAIVCGAPAIRAWLEDCEDKAYELARQGMTIPGQKLVESISRRTWLNGEEETAKAIMEETGGEIDSVMPRSLVGLGEAEKILAAALMGKGQGSKVAKDGAKTKMAYLTKKDPSGKQVLAPISDKRPAISVAVTRFGDQAINLPNLQQE
ncbi:Protein of unknown function DUF2800 [uncultured Caudovirales phage]|uniref:Uncharacterized protein n=1 Tax=uncultured Caudovirales phage TaxID=2100421 RepID=A0A6J5RPE3_9CAUD|nr:Protein of unknown function DUF2800 [uncultured Caudovirales phage]